MSLSDKINPAFQGILSPKDVREAVKELKQAFCLCGEIDKSLCQHCVTINEIFGEKLI